MQIQVGPSDSARWILPALLGVLAAGAFVAIVADEAEATHFRAGTLTATPTGNGREILVEGTLTFRRDYAYFSPVNPTVGMVTRVSDDTIRVEGSNMWTYLYIRVESSDPAANVLTGRIVASQGASLRFALPSDTLNGAPWKISMTDCCRISKASPLWHLNNFDASYRLEAEIAFPVNQPDSPARSLLPQIVSCVRPVCSFKIPVTDAQGHLTSFRLADASEMGPYIPGSAGGPAAVQPSAGGLSAEVGASNGVYTWNASRAPVDYTKGHNLYSTQVIVSSTRFETPVDFFIELVDSADLLPRFVSPSPCGAQVTLVAGQAHSMPIRAVASQANPSSPVRLAHVGLPSGATFQVDPASTTTNGVFTWTPNLAQVGTYLVVFTAVNTAQYWAPFCAVELVVTPSNAPIAKFSMDRPPVVGIPVNFTDESFDHDGTVVSRQWNFGDGTVLTTTATWVHHTYATEGPVSVQLLVADNTGVTGRTLVDLSVGPNAPPLAGLAADRVHVRSGVPVEFRDQSVDPEGVPLHRTFVFGDGTMLSAADAVVTHAFAADGLYTVRLAVSDGYNPIQEATLEVQVDSVAPVVAIDAVCPAGGGGYCREPVSYAMTATDPNLDTSALACSVGAALAMCEGTLASSGAYLLAVVARDLAGNEALEQLTVHVDREAPLLDLDLGYGPFEATGPEGFLPAWSFDATDHFPGSHSSGLESAACDHPAATPFPIGTTLVTCHATDRAGNAASVDRAVTVQDTTAPGWTYVPEQTYELDRPGAMPVTFATPTAHDLVSGPRGVVCDHAPGAFFGLGDHVVTCEAEPDAAGNVAPTATVLVRVVDTTPPVIDAASDVVLEAEGPDGAIAAYDAPLARDAATGVWDATCAPAAGARFALGATTVTCTASDGVGLDADPVTFTVTVVDRTPPAIAFAPDLVVEATGPDGALVAYDAPSTSDAVDGEGVASCGPASGSVFALGTTAVTCAASDAAGNAATSSFEVRVEDTTAPAIGALDDLVVEASGSDGAVVLFDAPWTDDAVDGAGVATCAPASGSTFPVGATTVTCTATDAAGNAATSSFVVEVLDGVGPVVTTPGDIVVVTASTLGRHVSYGAASAHDAVDGDVPVTCSPASGSLFPVGFTTVACRATDAAGNVGEGTFTVQVRYDWSGFLPPVVDGKSYNKGSTIPFKFRLANESAAASGLEAHLFAAPVVNGVVGAESPAPGDGSKVAGAPAHRFRFVDPTSSDPASHHLNVDTKKLAAGTWRFRADLGDGENRFVTLVIR
ncbi:MAG TPA: HYR domain-containing protein [Candidatus Thermoplasmatota archaeon]|nr:HYR domain-containing protein [Candidatus Thermoplasmatota archaeon]